MLLVVSAMVLVTVGFALVTTNYGFEVAEGGGATFRTHTFWALLVDYKQSLNTFWSGWMAMMLFCCCCGAVLYFLVL